MTLLEVMVAMTIMSVFGALFTAGITQTFHLVNRAEAKSDTMAQAHIAFTRLDKEIRYAQRISEPTKVGQTWYVEYLTHQVAVGESAPEWTCHALRLDGDRLQTLRWPLHDAPPVDSFAVLMSGVRATDPTAGPFALAADGGALQRLRFALTAGAASASASSLDVTFTAMNSSVTATNPAGDVCTEAR